MNQTALIIKNVVMTAAEGHVVHVTRMNIVAEGHVSLVALLTVTAKSVVMTAAAGHVVHVTRMSLVSTGHVTLVALLTVTAKSVVMTVAAETVLFVIVDIYVRIMSA